MYFNFTNDLLASFDVEQKELYKEVEDDLEFKQWRFMAIKKSFATALEQTKALVANPQLGLSFEERDKIAAMMRGSSLNSEVNFVVLNKLALFLIEKYQALVYPEFWVKYKELLGLEINSVNEGECDAADKNFQAGSNLFYEQAHIDAAVRNAFFVYLGLVFTIPEVYQRKFSKDINRESYRALVQSSYSLARQLSHLNFDLFRAFIYATTKLKSGLGDSIHRFQPKYFDIQEKQAKLILAFDGELLKQVVEQAKSMQSESEGNARAKLNFKEPAFGCPVIYNKDEDRQDVLFYLFSWLSKLLDEFFFVAL